MTLNNLIESNYSTLLRFGRSIIRDESGAKDLITETYLAILEKKFPETQEDFKRWFYKCMKLTSMSKYGCFCMIKSKEELLDSLDHVIDIAEPEGEKFERLKKIAELKKNLDPLDKILFTLEYEKNLSYREIAELYKVGGYKISTQSIYNLSKGLKAKINNLKKNS